ncbi:MAG TPA: hypothetical protein VJG32_03960 [Anaerolineae bacterium]|nr:hypothetical protein [Anaerolineae bacterium]
MISKSDRGDEELVGFWAARLQRWGVGDFAPIAVQLLRPFGFLGAQALHLFAPILTTFSSPASLDRLATLLESPEALDQLSDTIVRSSGEAIQSPPDTA